jgi:small subunit ribosomal protein S7
MARRKTVIRKRDIGVDERFKSEIIQKLMNVVMSQGKATIARRIVYDAMDILAKKVGNDDQKALQLFMKGFEQIAPLVEVRPRRVGGGVYQIPMEVAPARAQSLAFRWLINSAASRADKTMGQRLAYELLDAIEGRGKALAKRTEVHRMAEANRTFSHFAWN